MGKGRRGIGVDEPERWVFNRLAEAYRARPGYPEALIERLVALANGGPVADLGAGTGLMSIPLARAGLEVTAVEPAARMLDVLREQSEAAGVAVLPVNRPAEDTGLSPGFSLVVLADAAHWVDPERAGEEIHRLLAPGGTFAIVEPRFSDTPFMRAVAEALAGLNPRARRVHGRGEGQLFSIATAGASVHEERFDSAVPLDRARLEGALRSISYAGPALGDEALSTLTDRLHSPEALWRRDLLLKWSTLPSPAGRGSG